MDCVWKLKGPGAGAAGTSPFSERADSVDMLLAGRRMLRGVSGLRRAALFREGSRPPMSFQLAVLLVALERESGRSRAQSRSISMSASESTTSSSGGGSMRRGGVGEGGGRAEDRPEAMCLSRTAMRHRRGGGSISLIAVAVAIGLGIVGLGRSSPTAGFSLAHCNYGRRSAGMLVRRRELVC